jgi:hypothetical protein
VRDAPTVAVTSSLRWGFGTHSLAGLSFHGATYFGVIKLLPMLTGAGRDQHGQILREVVTSHNRRSPR